MCYLLGQSWFQSSTELGSPVVGALGSPKDECEGLPPKGRKKGQVRWKEAGGSRWPASGFGDTRGGASSLGCLQRVQERPSVSWSHSQAASFPEGRWDAGLMG